jgi:hypothetical protein
MPVRMRVERRGGQLLIEQLIGIVLATLQLRDDDRPLRLAVRRVVDTVRHPLRLDEQHMVERVAGGGLGVGGLVDPGVAVPVAAVLLDDALDLVAGMFVVPLKFMCSTQCETPVSPGGSSFEPTRYQHQTVASGAVCTSCTRTRRPLSSTSS